MKAILCFALLCVVGASAINTSAFNKITNALDAKRQVSTSGLGQGRTLTQIQTEYKKLLQIMESEKLNDQSTHEFSGAVSTQRLAAQNKDISKIVASFNAFTKTSGSVVQAGNTNWYIHSGTASYLYGVRDELSDLDMHFHGMAGSDKEQAHTLYLPNAHGNPLEVDSYDPCKDKYFPFFEAMESAVKITAASNPITASLANGYRVVSLNQLKFEYDNLQKDAKRQAIAAKKESDTRTLAGLDRVAGEMKHTLKSDVTGF